MNYIYSHKKHRENEALQNKTNFCGTRSRLVNYANRQLFFIHPSPLW